ncbi:hypothetical protein G9F73_000545 [Clostridium estertheticum]|uniref:hypothetical protein n=1 Tax=Clostridium estertheticum TaxID=238834 RepID=UPI001CCC2536|nr:hypothetical protein [Clostridium estertheticum]MBZ9606331.1 hypothetical protein [Clostridium estertheticum]
MLSIINYITQCLTIINKYGVNDLTFYINFNLGIISQFLLIVLIIIAVMAYTKKSCFEGNVKRGKVKEFFILWILDILWICIMLACVTFLDKFLVFKLNIIIVLIVGIVLYFAGNYFSEK